MQSFATISPENVTTAIASEALNTVLPKSKAEKGLEDLLRGLIKGETQAVITEAQLVKYEDLIEQLEHGDSEIAVQLHEIIEVWMDEEYDFSAALDKAIEREDIDFNEIVEEILTADNSAMIRDNLGDSLESAFKEYLEYNDYVTEEGMKDYLSFNDYLTASELHEKLEENLDSLRHKFVEQEDLPYKIEEFLEGTWPTKSEVSDMISERFKQSREIVSRNDELGNKLVTTEALNARLGNHVTSSNFDLLANEYLKDRMRSHWDCEFVSVKDFPLMLDEYLSDHGFIANEDISNLKQNYVHKDEVSAIVQAEVQKTISTLFNGLLGKLMGA